MNIVIPNLWLWFLACQALLLVTTYFMGRQSEHFFLQGVVRMKFSIFDMEFPGTPKTLPHMIRDIDNLPGDEAAKVKNALRTHTRIDFLFMPAAYVGIFLLCMHTANKMEFFGRGVFAVFAWMQGLPWLFDIIENFYLLNKIKNPLPSSVGVHKAYVRMVLAKWGLACTGAVCALFGTLYFWIDGSYSQSSLIYLVALVVEIVIFVIISRLSKTKKAGSIVPKAA